VVLDTTDRVLVTAKDASTVSELDDPRARRVVRTTRIQSVFCHLFLQNTNNDNLSSDRNQV